MRRHIPRAGFACLAALLCAGTGLPAGAAEDQPSAERATEDAAPASASPGAQTSADPTSATPTVRPRYGLTLPTAPPRASTARPAGSGRGHASPYHAMKNPERSRDYYRATWGIDKLRLVYTMSGNLIRFSFRVVEPKLAHPLGDHEATPQLYAPRAHAFLQVPTMEQVGPLRQLHTDKADEEFWLLFSNKGNLVRKGDRVDVIIGKFHADGLVVE